MKKYNLFIFIPLFGIISCTERIDVNTDDAPLRLVINGQISTDEKQHSVRITRSAGYFTDSSPEGVSNAEVTISGNDGKIILLTENDTIPGLYQTADNVRGEEGKTYTLDVKVNAQHYQATAHIARMNDLDSVVLRASTFFDNIVEVLVFAEGLDGDNNSYSIFVAINDSTLNPGVDRVLVSSRITSGMPCYVLSQNPERERSNILKIGDVVTVNINAIPKEYADFISQVNSELRGSNPIFGGPPANVTTNIRSLEGRGVSGFFTAFSSRCASVTVEEEFNTEKSK
jgi:hypothetical protein